MNNGSGKLDPNSGSCEFTQEEVAKAKEKWEDARSFKELCEFTACFVEGRFPYFPGYGGRTPASETEPIKEHLAAVNRRGLLTVSSQPGVEGEDQNGRAWAHRAYVSGYAEAKVAQEITNVTLYSDVVAYHLGPEESPSWFSIPAVKDENGPSLWIGRPPRQDPVSMLGSLDRVALLGEVASLHYVEAFDPRWGRSGYLWEQLNSVQEWGSEDSDSEDAGGHQCRVP